MSLWSLVSKAGRGESALCSLHFITWCLGIKVQVFQMVFSCCLFKWEGGCCGNFNTSICARDSCCHVLNEFMSSFWLIGAVPHRPGRFDTSPPQRVPHVPFLWKLASFSPVNTTAIQLSAFGLFPHLPLAILQPFGGRIGSLCLTAAGFPAWVLHSFVT